MISDVDAALRQLIGTQTFQGEVVKVDLDPPTKDWAARRSGPVLNLFLNDIREDTRQRTSNYQDVRDPAGVIIGRRPTERTFMFSYALSAWTSRPEDDHDLLGAALMGLLQYEFIPQQFCGGVLEAATLNHKPAMLKVGGILFSDRLVTELWTAIGGEFRPVIAVTVSVEIPAGLMEPVGPPQTEPPRFTFENTRSGQTTTRTGPRPRGSEVSDAPSPDDEAALAAAQADGGRVRTRKGTPKGEA